MARKPLTDSMRKRTKDPRRGSARLCYYCGIKRAWPGQHGFCSPPCRFWSKVKKTEGCWLWQGARHNSKGYGRHNANGTKWLAHRYVYELLIGPIPPQYELDHVVCGNTRCVNPAHLQPVTPEEHHRRTEQGAYNRLKTHCPRGHEYTVNNTRGDRYGRRHCRACDKERRR